MKLRRTRRPKRPSLKRSFRLTREGKSFVLVTLGVGIAAVNTGNNLLYLVLGLMLSLLLVSGVLSDLALLGVRARRILPKRMFAQTPFSVEIVLRNAKRFIPSFSLEVEDITESDETPTRSYFLKVPPRGEDRVFYVHVAPRRGRRRFTHLRLVTRYPFGLIEKGRVIRADEEVVIFPHIEAMTAPAANGIALAGAEAQRARGRGVEVAGLREYASGDEARDIHWRRTASLGRLVVREREDEHGAETSLAIDEARASEEQETFPVAFEAAVSRVASMAAATLASGRAASVVARTLPSTRVTPGQTPDALFRALALLEPIDMEDAPPLIVPRETHVVSVERAPRSDP